MKSLSDLKSQESSKLSSRSSMALVELLHLVLWDEFLHFGYF